MQAKRTFAEATRSADFEERMLEYERKIEELSGDPFPKTPSEWMRLLVKAGFSDDLINGFMASTEVEGFDECKPLPKGFVSVVSEESRPMFTARLVAGLERYQATTGAKSQGGKQARTKGRGRPSSHQKWEMRYDEYVKGLEATPAKWVNPTQYAKTKFGASNDGSQARKKFKEIQLQRDSIPRK
jgi:hypothetical protein